MNDSGFKTPGDIITASALSQFDAAIANAKPAPPPKTWEDYKVDVEKRMAKIGLNDSLPYFSRMVAKIKTGEYADRGAIFMGCTGCGKTKRAKLLSEFCGIPMFSAGNMALKLASVGNIEIQDILKCAYLGGGDENLISSHDDLIIDDLGQEPASFVLYGTRLDLMRMMLEERLNHADKVKTYITTNLTAAELTERYGKRVISRMREFLPLFKMPKVDYRIGNTYGWD